MIYFVSLIIAAFLGLIPANIAKNKGYSFGLWWFYGWMLFIVAIIHVQFIPDKNVAQGVYQNPNGSYNPTMNGNNTSIADELMKYKELYDQGVLTEEEFQMKKTELLQKMG